MGARPSSFKKSGGFLNNVNAVITGYRFTDETPSKEGPQKFVPGKVKGADNKMKDRFHSLYFELTVRADGAKEDVSQSLFAGGADDYVIIDDGLTLTAPDEGPCTLGENTAAARLIGTMVEAGFDENQFSEDENSVNFEPIVGQHVHFVQRRLDADEVRARKLDPRGRQDRQDKNKFYAWTELAIDQVYGAVEVVPPPAAPPIPVATKATKAPTKGNGKVALKTAAVPAEDEVSDLARTTLVDILGENGGSIQKIKLSTRVLQLLTKTNVGKRDDVRKWLFSDDNLNTLVNEGLITYDQSTGQIVAA